MTVFEVMTITPNCELELEWSVQFIKMKGLCQETFLTLSKNFEKTNGNHDLRHSSGKT